MNTLKNCKVVRPTGVTALCPFLQPQSYFLKPVNPLSVHQMPPDLVTSSRPSLVPCNNHFPSSPTLTFPAHLSPLPSSATLLTYRSSSFVPLSVRLGCDVHCFHVPACLVFSCCLVFLRFINLSLPLPAYSPVNHQFEISHWTASGQPLVICVWIQSCLPLKRDIWMLFCALCLDSLSVWHFSFFIFCFGFLIFIRDNFMSLLPPDTRPENHPLWPSAVSTFSSFTFFFFLFFLSFEGGVKTQIILNYLMTLAKWLKYSFSC